jgi:uncharacterized protein
MSDDFAALDSFAGTAPLFPLPNVVLYPHVMLPLHVFEPRYRQMTADALAGDRLIAMALLRPGWEADYEGRPQLYDTVCLGKVVADQPLDDGRYNLLLRGLARARILGEVPGDKLYRIARLELLRDVDLLSPHQAQELRDELVEPVGRWFEGMGLGRAQLQKLVESNLPLGPLGDVLSFALPLGVEFKQELLEELAVERRVRLLIRHLETATPPSVPAEADRAFPPDFSSN